MNKSEANFSTASCAISLGGDGHFYEEFQTTVTIYIYTGGYLKINMDNLRRESTRPYQISLSFPACALLFCPRSHMPLWLSGGNKQQIFNIHTLILIPSHRAMNN